MAEIVTVLLLLGMAIIQLILGLGLAVVAIYIGMNLVDKLTVGIAEMEELKKKNVAVGIVMGAVVLAIGIVISSGVVGMTKALTPGKPIDIWVYLGAIGSGIAQVFVGMIFAVIAIYIALNVIKRILGGTVVEKVAEKAVSKATGTGELMKNIDIFEELKNGNTAIGVLVAAILIAVAVVVQAGVSGIATALGVAI